MDKEKLDKEKKKLLDLIRSQRKRIDPALLKKAREAIERVTASPGMEPYDKNAAFKVIQRFLESHDDPADFRERLRQFMGEKNH